MQRSTCGRSDKATGSTIITGAENFLCRGLNQLLSIDARSLCTLGDVRPGQKKKKRKIKIVSAAAATDVVLLNSRYSSVRRCFAENHFWDILEANVTLTDSFSTCRAKRTNSQRRRDSAVGTLVARFRAAGQLDAGDITSRLCHSATLRWQQGA